MKAVEEARARIEPGDVVAIETVEHEAPAQDEAPVGRGRRLTSLAVALYLLGQAMILLINGTGGSNDLLMANLVRLAVFGMVGGLAIGGRTWARWFIGVFALLNAVVVVFGTLGNLDDFSSTVLALTGAVFVAFLAAAYLLLFAPAVRR